MKHEKCKIFTKSNRIWSLSAEFYGYKNHIKKRANNEKVKKGLFLYKKEKILISKLKKFSVEKELLLALIGIETNYGKYLGEMDILSSLATLSFDKVLY